MIYRSKLVERVLPATLAAGDQLNFANDADLQTAYIVGISTFINTEVAKAPSGADVIADLSGLTITIAEYSQKERIRNQPLSDFQTSQQGGFYRQFYPFSLNWQDSYLTVNDPTNLVGRTAAVFTVFFIPQDELEKYEELYQFYGQ